MSQACFDHDEITPLTLPLWRLFISVITNCPVIASVNIVKLNQFFFSKIFNKDVKITWNRKFVLDLEKNLFFENGSTVVRVKSNLLAAMGILVRDACD